MTRPPSTESASDDGAADATESADAGETIVEEEESEAFPQVTFPEATVRDPEAEAADRERRQSVIGLFERLRVQAERRAGYDREAVFDGWLYSGGQSTRDRVLASEQLPDGTWFSTYDSVVVLAAADLDIDHTVPLAEAWESGGHAWSADTWTRFGNDLDDPRSLIAVSASTNRSKGAKDPQDWWPPESGYRCQYAADWIAVKARWNLTMDAAEQRSIDAQLESCSGAEFVFSSPLTARVTLAESSTAPEDDSSAAGEPDAVQEAIEEPANDCHPAYEPCLPYLPGDALNCGDLTAEQKPVRVKEIGVDPYRLDRDRNGLGCTS
ncbi:HNH endonuclease family protein [Candidatus Poriferisodalis sp.]|uniref:HNH endonuclease family protein n=1 Tax=Candidatus Poriferisodalis sp. TaxID=3101277 RepID=UPI003B0223CB